VESTSKCVDCKGKKVVVAESYEDTIKLKEAIVMLKKELQEQAKHKTIVIESMDQDKKLAYENKLLKEENQYLKLGLMYDKQEEYDTFILDELASNNDPIIKQLTQENCRCFAPGGSHQRVSLYACSLSQMVMRERHRGLSWSGQEKALRLAGEDVFYYLAPKCLCGGEYRRVLLRMVVVMYGWLFYV